MSWLGKFIMRGLLGSENDPNKVVEVKSDKYSDKRILSREDSIVLYESTEGKYEIVMHRPCSESLYQAYSLFRTEDRSEAEVRFIAIKDKLPLLCNLSSTNLTTLQKFCTTLQEHPSWTVCHLAVHFNLLDSLNHSQIVSHINSTDGETGVSPLQIGVQSGSVAVINRLLSLGASLGHLDHEGNTVFHHAACSSKDIIMALANKEKDVLNTRNRAGQTALHKACLADKPDCVKALLLCGADVNLSAGRATSKTTTPPGVVGDFLHENPNKLQAEEMKFGGTPLHWSSSKEVIDALLDCNCDINALNFDSRTALHVMVMRGYLECCVALLSREADSSIGDLDGNTPLHLAAALKNISIVQALIVFGADLSLMNHAGFSARHVATQGEDEASERVVFTLAAVGAPRCRSDVTGCRPGCIVGGSHDGLPPPPASAPAPRQVAALLEAETLGAPGPCPRGGRLLCLDGGGIRGLVLVTLLLHLEEAVGRPILHCFDWLAATSTGAILALALAAGKSLKECLCLYFRMKDVAFSGYRPYSSEPLESMLKETLGTDTTMADILHPKKPVDLHLFRNYESPSEMLGGEVWGGGGEPRLEPPPHFSKQLLWEAARASGAAPSYFRAFGRYVDGGLIANNPTLDAMTEIHEYNCALRHLNRESEVVQPSVVVSLGTGSIPLTQVESMDIFWPSGLLETAKLVSGVRSMQAVLVEQATLADGRVVDRTRAVCSMIGLPYFRFSPQLSEEIVMDEKSDVKLVHMLWETKAYILENQGLVSKLAALLCSE